jgi:2-polyprenyl-3-methyl-5-hydroxy-6-metoxy-1,4-benzoquinol methylase
MLPASSSDQRDDWDQHWTDYNDSAEANPAQEWRRDVILALLDLKPSDKLLDIGSGQGDLARDILQAHPKVLVEGLELSQSGVDRAKLKVGGANFHQINLLTHSPEIPALKGWANKLVCAEVLEHLDDPRTLLVNALQYAAPGARIVITVPSGPRTAFDRHIGHRKHYDRTSLRALMESAGLTVERCDAAGFPFFNIYRSVVFMRGKKLIADVAGETSAVSSGPTRLLLRVFHTLFRLNLRTGGLGWQMVAVGTVTTSPPAKVTDSVAASAESS